MKIDVKIDARYTELQVLIMAAKLTGEVSELMRRLEADSAENIVGFDGDTATLLNPADIVRVFSENQKVYAQSQTAQYLLRMRLYEAETLLSHCNFVRISNSEIVNLRKVESLDLSMAGTICVKLKNGQITFASRRYVSKIKQTLKL